MTDTHSALIQEPATNRYLSLDVLRGLTLALMVVVNSPGDHDASFAPLKHAAWNGFTLTDLVFPTFMFVVGNAMSFTMPKSLTQSDAGFLKKVFIRTLIIMVIGVIMNIFFLVRIAPDGTVSLDSFNKIRLVCVLERIGFAYCIASLLLRYTSEKAAIIFCIVTLPAYWAVMYFFGDQPDPYSLTGNAVTKFDLMTIGDNHIWHGEGVPFDPEGVLSSWPSIVNVLAGYFAGKYVRRTGVSRRVVVNLVLAGISLIAAALVWDIVFPLNKKLWTSSYVLITVGWDAIALGALIFVIDILGITRWTGFFVVFGKNPLFLYICAGLLSAGLYTIHSGRSSWKSIIYQSVYQPFFHDKVASLLFALSLMLIVWLIGYGMDKNKIYIKA